MDSKALYKLIHGLTILAFLAFFGGNLYSLIQRVNVVTQSFSVEKKTALVPPALTFCISRQVVYNFTLELYGEVKATGDSPNGYISTYNNETEELKALTDIVYKCWIIKVPVDDMRFNYTRIFDNPGQFQPAAPIVLNVFDPLKQSNIFDEVNKFLLLDTDVNRAISFSRVESRSLNKTVTSDVKYNIIEVFRDNLTLTTPNNATSSIRIRPDSFNIEITADVVTIGPWEVIVNSFTLMSVLLGNYYALVGRGKYKPWGWISSILRYFPVEHMKEKGSELSIQEEGFKDDGNMNISEKTKEPSISEILKVYLDKFELAKYDE
ncbi:2842_t:CDS:2 [Cetraspora pellucida]|uniref:2842_t:CDS:1 n=1 Tax=Cetraspora pellucida TaxID=1433469 RepID=A0A9N8VIT7_9GLOM|nr:2842_t:CDS:2 [Cetraspora pellucida]